MRAVFVSKDFSQISVKEFESIEEFSENVTDDYEYFMLEDINSAHKDLCLKPTRLVRENLELLSFFF
jgi:hypothetical protein